MKRSMSRSKARFSASRVTLPASSRAQKAWKVGLAVGVGQSRLEDAEEVVDPVVERVRVALDVEEQVARARLGQREEAAIRLEAAVLEAARLDQLVERPAGALRPRPVAAPARWSRSRISGRVSSRGGSSGSIRPARPRRVGSPRAFSARRWRVAMPATSDRSSSPRAVAWCRSRPSGRRRSARRARDTSWVGG